MPIFKTQYISKFLITRILIDVRIYDIRQNLDLFFDTVFVVVLKLSLDLK